MSIAASGDESPMLRAFAQLPPGIAKQFIQAVSDDLQRSGWNHEMAIATAIRQIFLRCPDLCDLLDSLDDGLDSGGPLYHLVSLDLVASQNSLLPWTLGPPGLP